MFPILKRYNWFVRHIALGLNHSCPHSPRLPHTCPSHPSHSASLPHTYAVITHNHPASPTPAPCIAIHLIIYLYKGDIHLPTGSQTVCYLTTEWTFLLFTFLLHVHNMFVPWTFYGREVMMRHNDQYNNNIQRKTKLWTKLFHCCKHLSWTITNWCDPCQELLKSRSDHRLWLKGALAGS